MRYLILTLLAVASFALPVQAKLGETRAQLIQRFGRAALKINAEHGMEFVNKNTVFIDLVDGRSVAEMYCMKTKFNQDDADEIAQIVTGTTIGDAWTKAADGFYESPDGRFAGKVFRPDSPGEFLWFATVGYPRAARQMLHTETKRVEPRPDGSTKNDCLIVATEAFARLSKTAVWARIGSFMISRDGKVLGGHAVTFYQPTATSNVWVYDSNEGSIELRTQSHDLTEIMIAYNKHVKPNWRLYDAEWIDDMKKAASTTQAREEEVPSTSESEAGLKPASDTPDLTTAATTAQSSTPAVNTVRGVARPAGELTRAQAIYLLCYYVVILIGFGLYLWAICVCFEKGKPRFAIISIAGLLLGGFSLFAIIGACRIAKPHSWWARNRYGPEKMKIALQRFAHLYKDETRKAIEQSIQVIDISRKVQA